MPFVYILHSHTADKFYIGATSVSPAKRLKLHQVLYYGNKKFTSKYKDWTLFHAIECSSFSQARKIENHIKKMKSKTYIRKPVHAIPFVFHTPNPYIRTKIN